MVDYLSVLGSVGHAGMGHCCCGLVVFSEKRLGVKTNRDMEKVRCRSLLRWVLIWENDRSSEWSRQRFISSIGGPLNSLEVRQREEGV